MEHLANRGCFWGEYIMPGAKGTHVEVPKNMVVQITNMCLPFEDQKPGGPTVRVTCNKDRHVVAVLSPTFPSSRVEVNIAPGSYIDLFVESLGKTTPIVHATGYIDMMEPKKAPQPDGDNSDEEGEESSADPFEDKLDPFEDAADPFSDEEEEEEEEYTTGRIEELPSDDDDDDDEEGDADESASVETLEVQGKKYYREKGTNKVYTHSTTAPQYVGEYDEKHRCVVTAKPPPKGKPGKRGRE